MGLVDFLKSALSKVGEFDRRAVYGPDYKERAANLARLNELKFQGLSLENDAKFERIQQLRQQAQDRQDQLATSAFNNAVSFGSSLDTTPQPGFVSPTNPGVSIEDVDPNNILHKPGEGMVEPSLPSFIKSQIRPEDEGTLGMAIRAGRAHRKKGEFQADQLFEANLGNKQLADDATLALINQRNASAERARREPVPKADNDTLPPEGLDIATVNYIRSGGNVPPRSSPKLIREIIARAGTITDAEIQSVLNSGRDLAGNRGNLRADTTSLGRVVGNRDAVQSAERTVDKNIEVLKSTLSGITETGVPLLNRGARWFNDRILGDPHQKEYQSAYEVVQPEVAKLLTSPNPLTGVLTDTAREEIRAFMSQDATIEQTKHVLDLLEKDRRNRLLALDETVSEVRGRVSPRSTTQKRWVKGADGIWREQ